MEDQTIQNLREALAVSPNNVPLRLHLAETLLAKNYLEQAIVEFQRVLKQENNPKAKLGLAKAFYAFSDFSKCNVILEELRENGFNNSFEVLLLHTQALVKENLIADAIQTYQKVIQLNPDYTNQELDQQLRQQQQSVDVAQEIEGDQGLQSHFLQNVDMNFSHVGGMEEVKKEIDLKIIQPLLHPEIYKAYGKKIGGGILLYGPPGCGKTYIAKATAGQINAKFISVSLNDILDMWMGNSEKNLHNIFTLARQNKPCVLFFDEIDALGASRSDMQKSSGRHIINQFLHELDGVDNDNEGILVLGATNTPWSIDPAFKRPGRFDRVLFVPPPDLEARASIYKLKLEGKPVEAIDYNALAKKSEKYSGADIEAVIDRAIESKLEEAIKLGKPSPLKQKELLKATKQHKATTAEWFTSAKNYALYSNQSGFYDPILTFMNIKK